MMTRKGTSKYSFINADRFGAAIQTDFRVLSAGSANGESGIVADLVSDRVKKSRNVSQDELVLLAALRARNPSSAGFDGNVEDASPHPLRPRSRTLRCP